MSSIKLIKPKACPNCKATDSFYYNTDGILSCRLCGWLQRPVVRTKPAQALANDSFLQRVKARRALLRPTYLVNEEGVNSLAVTAFRSGMDYIHVKDWDGAIRCFKRALEYDDDFLILYLWLAYLADNPAEKYDYLDTVLARQPDSIEAIRERLFFEGKITIEQFGKITYFEDLKVFRPDVPVEAEADEVDCPICGGALSTDENDGHVFCTFCSYDEITNPHPRYKHDRNLIMALITRRAKGSKWEIGNHLIVCDNCGAERTSVGKLSSNCPFCGSTNVLIRDAFDSFQEPDLIIPFTLARAKAKALIQRHLNSRTERIKGLFTKNDVTSASLTGVYLPAWLFDCSIQVNRTTIKKANAYSRTQTITTDRFDDALFDMPVLAVHSPRPEYVSKILPYQYKQALPYDMAYLSKFSAEMYSLDWDQASLEVRSLTTRSIQERYTTTYDSDLKISVSSFTRNMTFKLCLVPVWIATLVEEDGDVRLGFVNGQTGQTSLTRVQKAPRIQIPIHRED